MSVERRLSAILAADVVGYSGLMERDEAGTVARLKQVLTEIVEPAIAAHRGQVFKRMGDGLLAEFASAVEAVQAAIDMQQALAAVAAQSPAGEGLQYRIGIHVGDVILEGDDRLGDGVNVAARLQALAHPGGVALSGSAYEQVRDKVDCAFEDGGEHQVKNLLRPLRVWHAAGPGAAAPPKLRRMPVRATVAAVVGLAAVVAVYFAFAWPPGDGHAGDLPVVAVLPFDNFDGDAASGRLADGLTEDVINDLARYRDFAVASRNSTERFKGKAVDVKEVARALGADFVLEGSIQHQADKLRITAQLIDAGTGNHLWSEHWDRPDRDFFAVQEEIAREVGNRLGGGVGLVRETQMGAARRKSLSSLSAYELFLLGDEKFQQADPASVAAGVDLLMQATTLDPGLARAWASLAQAYSMISYSGGDVAENRRLSMEAATKGVAADPNDASARIAMGYAYGDRGDFVRAKAEFDEALRLAPHSSHVLIQNASWAASFGDPAHGAELADQVLALDPHLEHWAASRLAYAYFAAGQDAKAVAVLDGVPPDVLAPDAMIVLPCSLAALGRVGEASHWLEEALKRNPRLTIESWINEGGYTPAETEHFVTAMRLAGFPACAKPGEEPDFSKYGRLPECVPGTAP